MNHRTHSLVLAAVFLSLSVVAVADAEPVSVLLERGIYNEETVGDLNAAIAIYQQIIDDEKANRTYAAQAQYRLAACYIKTGRNTQGVAELKKLIANFSDKKAWVAKAQERLTEVTGQMSHAEIARIVEDVVKAISTRAEGDPAVALAMESLEGLDEQLVVSETAKWLVADKETVRRSAIYVLWKGTIQDISAAVPALRPLLSSPDQYARGMAALALGRRNVASEFDALVEMMLHDESGFARRCAAYALGELGDPRARPELEKALSDKEQLVRNNAEAALTMLERSGDQTPGRLPAAVMEYIVAEYLKAVGEAMQKELHVNVHIYGVDNEFNLHSGGFLGYRNDTNKPNPGPIHLGNFGRQRPDYILSDEQGREQEFEIRERPGERGGRWGLWWKPTEPAQPGVTRLLGYMKKDSKRLPEIDGERQLSMNNHFGSPVLESFFLVLPEGMTITRKSAEPKSKASVDEFDIYLWQREVPSNTTNEVTVSLARSKGGTLQPARKYMDLGQYDRALVAYQALLKAEPENKDAKAGLKKAQHAADAVKKAKEAAEVWLKVIDAGEYGQSWEEMSALAKSAVTKAQWARDAAMLGSLGKLKSRTLLSAKYATSVPGAPDGEYVIMEYESSFENKAKAVETITPMKDTDEAWRVAGYLVQ